MTGTIKRVDFFVSFLVPEETNEIVLTLKLEEALRTMLGTDNIHVAQALIGAFTTDQKKELH